MGVMAFEMLHVQSNQMKSNNFIDFQMKRSQVQTLLVNQFLSDPINCGCLFKGVDQFSQAGTPALTGVTPRAVGRYNFVTVGECERATIPQPLLTTTGNDGLLMSSVEIRNVIPYANNYGGDFIVTVESTKEILGPKQLQIKIPVVIQTKEGTPGHIEFVSCSAANNTGGDRNLQAIKNRANIQANYVSPCYGGTGGNGQVTSTCPGGSFLNSFDGRKSPSIEKIAGRCMTVDGITSIPSTFGGGVGVPFAIESCATGSYANGIHGHYTNRVEGFGLNCMNPLTSANSSTSEIGNTTGASFNWSCPGGAYIFELRADLSNMIDCLQAVCADLPP